MIIMYKQQMKTLARILLWFASSYVQFACTLSSNYYTMMMNGRELHM